MSHPGRSSRSFPDGLIAMQKSFELQLGQRFDVRGAHVCLPSHNMRYLTSKCKLFVGLNPMPPCSAGVRKTSTHCQPLYHQTCAQNYLGVFHLLSSKLL